MLDWQKLIDLIPALLMAIGSFLASYALIRKGKAEVKNYDAEVAGKYQEMLLKEQTSSLKYQESIKNMRIKIEALEEKIELIEETLEEYAAGVDLLLNQMKVNGIIPVWKPKKRYVRKETD